MRLSDAFSALWGVVARSDTLVSHLRTLLSDRECLSIVTELWING